MEHFHVGAYAELLAKWVVFSQRHLYHCPEREGRICYGAGEHGHWGVHTHQKAFSAFAVAAVCEDIHWTQYGITREQVREQALCMLRYTLDTHLTGDLVCTDGGTWGHNWIYALGVERMFHGVEALEPYLTDHDREQLRAMLLSECDFLLKEYPVRAGLVKDNKPESNIWNGAMLIRGAVFCPDTPNRDRYIQKAREFFANGISVEADEHSDEIVDGRRIGDLFVGANLFDTYACNHHGYMNVGYMVICLSNIAMIHFSLKAKGMKADAMVYRHVRELWQLIRTCTFDDGRLLRIGGDSRARYCYCQDYVLPMWALIEDIYGEDCSRLEAGWLKLLQTETAVNGDGSFLSNRFGDFEALSPVYYTRLESDRANAVSMALYWHQRYGLNADQQTEELLSWHDSYHGAAFSGYDNRYASFVWRASEKPQALLVPRDDSSLAEWRYNLCGRIEGVGRINDDEVADHREQMFEGGFLTCGSTFSTSDQFMAEGQMKETMARKHIAFAALPDGGSVLCLQHAYALNRTFVSSVRGILWNIPNDIFNGRQRVLTYEHGRDCLRGGDYAKRFETIDAGKWVNADEKVGMASITPLTVVRAGKRQVEIVGRENSATLYAEEICAPYIAHSRWYSRGEEIYRAKFAMTLGGSDDTRALSESLFMLENGWIQCVGATGKDGRVYVLAANFGEEAAFFHPDSLQRGLVVDVGRDASRWPKRLESDEAVLLVLA